MLQNQKLNRKSVQDTLPANLSKTPEAAKNKHGAKGEAGRRGRGQ